MTGGEVIALVSVVSSALVGPTLVARFGMARARWDARREREDALVTVVEKAAIDLTETNSRIQDDIHEMTQEGATTERSWELVNAHMPLFLNLWQNETKIALRLSTASAITVAYRSAAHALSRVGVVLAEVAAGEPFDGGRIRAVNAEKAAAFEHMQRFLDLGAERIGPGEADGLRRVLAGRLALRRSPDHAADRP